MAKFSWSGEVTITRKTSGKVKMYISVWYWSYWRGQARTKERKKSIVEPLPWDIILQVSQLLRNQNKDLTDKLRYIIPNLVTNKGYVVDVTHLRPFYYEPAYVTPSTSLRTPKKRWWNTPLTTTSQTPRKRNGWYGGSPTHSLKPRNNSRRVQTFQHYCASNRLDPFPPKVIPQSTDSFSNMSRRTATGQLKFLLVEPTRQYEGHIYLRTSTYSLDAHVADRKRGQLPMVTNLKMHKAFPLEEGLNGIDVAVWETFCSTSVRISGWRLVTGHAEHTKHYWPQPQKCVWG